jgi:hypothetical protein
LEPVLYRTVNTRQKSSKRVKIAKISQTSISSWVLQVKFLL